MVSVIIIPLCEQQIHTSWIHPHCLELDSRVDVGSDGGINIRRLKNE